MDSRDRWRLGRRPALDGLRGVAILLVVASHLFKRFDSMGTVGVTVFFTLSGFLITTLLVSERTRTGAVDMARFYRHRALRLLPALVVFLLVMLTLSAVLDGGFASLGSVAVALGYATNWVAAFGHAGYMGPLGHTWSLSVEEQFYVLWPLAVLLASRSRHQRRILYTLCGLGVVWAWWARIALWNSAQGSDRVYFGFDTRMDALLVGCALAVFMAGRSEHRARSRAADLIVAMTAVTILLVATYEALTQFTLGYLLWPGVVPLTTAAALFLIVGSGYAGVLRSRWLVVIGQRSYGLYLWHVGIIYLVERYVGTMGRPAVVGLAVVLSLAATEVSWRLVERPFLRLKDRTPGGSRNRTPRPDWVPASSSAA